MTDTQVRDLIVRHSKLSQQAPRLKAMLEVLAFVALVGVVIAMPQLVSDFHSRELALVGIGPGLDAVGLLVAGQADGLVADRPAAGLFQAGGRTGEGGLRGEETDEAAGLGAEQAVDAQ